MFFLFEMGLKKTHPKKFRRFAAILPPKMFRRFAAIFSSNIVTIHSYTNDRNITQSARSAKILAFSTLFFEICYYFRHRFVSQHSSNPCTIIQLGQKTSPVLTKNPAISTKNSWIFFRRSENSWKNPAK